MKRKMLQFSPQRAEMLDQVILAAGYPTEKKKMFGHEVHFLNGYMFSGANEDGFFVHIGMEARDAALENETGVDFFRPVEGMTMKEYLLVKEPGCSDADTLKQWLDRASAYLLSLPPKKKKPKKKSAAARR